MTKLLIDELEEAKSSSTPLDRSESTFLALTKAFEIFSYQAKRLEKAYASLQDQFACVSHQLEDSNVKLSQKVRELDMINRYLDCLVNNMAQGLLFIQLDGIITTCNASAEKALLLNRPEILYKHYIECFSDNFFGFSLQEALQKHSAPLPCFIQICDQYGELKELEISSSFVLDQSANSGLIVLIRDMTEYRRLQELAARNHRMQELGEMAAALAHEIRNPLGGIEGFASLLHRDLSSHPEQQKMTDYIIDGTRALNKMVTQVLNYARPLHLERKRVNVVSLVKELCDLLQNDPILTEEHIEISFSSSKPLILALVDEAALRSALLNIMINAVQAMEDIGGTLHVSIESKAKEILIKIIDTGKGIARNHLEKIFSPFFTTKPKGNGFGLSEAFKIVQLHEGNIEVNSMVHRGTTFTIRIPEHTWNTETCL